MLALSIPPSPCRFRHLLAAVCSILPSPHHHLLDLEGDGGGYRSRRRAAREGSRVAQGAEKRSQRERGGAAEGSGAVERRGGTSGGAHLEEEQR
jgi:hypothetical protein